jgi:uncharacterized protein (TIGR00725 family)
LKNERKPIVSVIGASDSTESQTADAEKVGRLLAEQGVVLVCGGRGGVMQAACRGALEAGGLTVGILPGIDADVGNPYLSISLPTGLNHARNVLVVLAGQIIIAIGGGSGTLSEIALALKMGKKVIGLYTWQAKDFQGELAQIHVVNSPEEALAVVKADLATTGLGE